MSRRRYNRRRHNKNKELGCIVEMIFVPIALILALITSKDPAKKSVGLGLGILLALIVILGSVGVPAEAIIIILGILIGLFILGVSKESSSPQIENKEEPIQTEKVVTKEPKHEQPKKKETSEKVKKDLKVEQPPKDTLYDNSLVLISTNGQYVNEVITRKNKASSLQEKNKEAAIKSDYAKHLAPARDEYPCVFYSSIEDAVNKNRVLDSYCKIMIEQIRNTNVKECPGIAWKDSQQFYILPLLVNSPTYSWPLEQVSELERLKIMDVDPDQTYLDLIGQPIADEFEELMPEYFMGDVGIDTERYILSDMIEVTYASGKTLKKMLGL